MMGWVRRWWRRISTLLQGGRAHREVEEEMRFHVDMEAADLRRSGLSPDDAHREALRRFGGVDRHREAVREARGVGPLEDLVKDVRGALRGLRRSPVFATVALLTLALGIGATTAIFSVVQAVLLRPLPYPEAARLVRVRPSWQGTPEASLSPVEYFDLRETGPVSSLGAYAYDDVALTGQGNPERVQGVYATAQVLPALGIEPRIGRWFNQDEDETDAAVALLSHGLWMRRFGGDPSIVGRTIEIDGRSRRVLGVLSEELVFPEDLASSSRTQVVLPLGLSPAETTSRGSHFLLSVGRLPPQTTAQDAGTRIGQAAQAMVRDYPDDYPADMNFDLHVLRLDQDVLGDSRPTLEVLVGAVGFLLLIACTNVANLLLARSEERESELALRSALGAGRGRLVRQLLAESLTLSLLGALGGAALAMLCTRGLLALGPPDLPRTGDIRVDATALLFSVGLASVIGIACGLIPALRAGRTSASARLRESGGRGSGGRAGKRMRRGLVVAELAAALVLLAGAGLLMRSLADLIHTDPGYRTANVLTAELSLPAARYPGADEVTAFFTRLTDELEGYPEVLAAGGATNLPLATSLGDLNFHIEGRPEAEGEVSPRADWQVVTPDYLPALGIDPVQGRLLDERDARDAPGAVVISRTTAQRYWPDGGALGARFLLGGGAAPGWVTVVGIVPDVAHQSLNDGPSAQMYLPQAQFRFWGGGGPVRSLDLVIHTAGAPAEATSLLRDVVQRLDPSLPVANVRTMEAVVSRSLARARLLASLVAAFALAALVLAAVGIYGVTAYTVGRRTRELGIRLALGADGGRVLRLVLGETTGTVGLGLGLGLAGALLMGGLLDGILFGVEPSDPPTLALAALALALIALTAAWVPARRATRVNPALPLRAE